MSYEEQIMSKDKHPSIFSPQMEAIVFIILQIFFATRAVLKTGEYSWDIICSSKPTVFCSLLGTDNVQGQISEDFSAPAGNYCLFIRNSVIHIHHFVET